MKNLYKKMSEGMEKIKSSAGSKIRTYALASAFALGLAYNASGQEIYNDTKIEVQNNQQTEIAIKLDSLKKAYQTTFDSAAYLFNKGIEDRRLTVKEQKEILKKYSQAKTKLCSYNVYAKENNLETITMKDKYFELIEGNIKYGDFGVPELEKQLKEDGLNVRVSRYQSEGERGVFDFFIILMGFISLSGIGLKGH